MNNIGENPNHSSNESPSNKPDEFIFIQEDSHYKVSYPDVMKDFDFRILNADDGSTSSNSTSTKMPYNVLSQEDMDAAFIRQICIWLPISLGLVLLFTVLGLIYMPIQKNSILYAKYGTTKQMQGQ